MSNYLPLNPEAKFSYKGWIITIEQVFNMKIYYSIDVFGIHKLISEALERQGKKNAPGVQSLLESLLKEGVNLYMTYETSDTVFHTFNWVNKCKDDAIRKIDNTLGDGISYAKNKNLMPSLKYFV
jgi:hypothetical protein